MLARNERNPAGQRYRRRRRDRQADRASGQRCRAQSYAEGINAGHDASANYQTVPHGRRYVLFQQQYRLSGYETVHGERFRRAKIPGRRALGYGKNEKTQWYFDDY